MKKIFAVAIAIILGTSVIHAVDIELDVMYYPWILNRATTVSFKGKSVPKDAKSAATYNSPFLALGLNGNFYLAEKGIAKLGVSVAGGFDFGYIRLMPVNLASGTGEVNLGWGGGGFLKVGFASSINFNDVHSLYISPGIILTGATGTWKAFLNDNRISTVLFGLDIDVGYRAFFLHASNFDFGIDCGLNIDFPLGGLISSTTTQSSEKHTFKYGAFGGGFKLYVGPAFRLK